MYAVSRRPIVSGQTRLRFENARIGNRQLQLLAEYVAGLPFDGQFYTQHLQWFGIGFHFYF
ncbi:MAG: DUF1207 domain-containing protein [Nitrospira sp.]